MFEDCFMWIVTLDWVNAWTEMPPRKSKPKQTWIGRLKSKSQGWGGPSGRRHVLSRCQYRGEGKYGKTPGARGCPPILNLASIESGLKPLILKRERIYAAAYRKQRGHTDQHDKMPFLIGEKITIDFKETSL